MYDRITPTNKAILLANLGIFGLQYLFGPVLQQYFALWPPSASRYFINAGEFQIWQLLTYGFLHSQETVFHIAFNMFAVYMFGSEIERLFGAKRYLIYYLSSIVGAALMHLIVVEFAQQPPYPTVGASGGVFGLLLAFGMAWPHRKLMLIFPPIPMPAWLFVTLYGIAELWMGITGTAQGVAHFAHLGGMLTGFVLIRYWRSQARRR